MPTQGGRCAILLLSLTLGACSALDLPKGWEDAEEIKVLVSDCYDDEALASFEITDDSDPVFATYFGASFRCAQEVCAYYMEKGGVAKVLAQPCDLNPREVARCSCRYDLSFEFPRPSSDAVEIWHGTDAYASAPEQELVFEVDLSSVE